MKNGGDLRNLLLTYWDFTDFVFKDLSSKRWKRFDEQSGKAFHQHTVAEMSPTKMGYFTKDKCGYTLVKKRGNGTWSIFPIYEAPFISLISSDSGIFQPLRKVSWSKSNSSVWKMMILPAIKHHI